MDLQALNSVVQSGELFLAFGNETENEKGPETLQFWARLWPNLLHSEMLTSADLTCFRPTTAPCNLSRLLKIHLLPRRAQVATGH